MEEISVAPISTELYIVIGFAGKILESADCPKKIRTRLEIVIDEIFGNIVKYSGADSIRIRAGVDDEGMFVMTFIDNGDPYDPLDAPEPDTESDIDDRPIGGLGIFIVKNSMDGVIYEYKDGHNNLTIKKKI